MSVKSSDFYFSAVKIEAICFEACASETETYIIFIFIKNNSNIVKLRIIKIPKLSLSDLPFVGNLFAGRSEVQDTEAVQ